MTTSLSALADPTRRAILQLLRARDLSAGEIAANFEISLPSVSHHLATLKAAELVTTQRRGQNIIYSLNATVMQEFLQLLMTTFGAEAHEQKPNKVNGENQ